MSSDIGFEEAERRRLEFASKRRARHSISKGVEGVGRRSIFASHGEDGHDYMVKLAMEKLDADAANRTATAAELSVRQSTLRSSYFQRRTRKRRRMCLALSSLLPLLHRGCSMLVLLQFWWHGLGAWAGAGFVILGLAGVAEGWLTGTKTRDRNGIMPKPEMTRDGMGKPIPRTMHDCHCPLSIIVQLPAARSLAAMDFGGTSDPYVVVKLLGKKKVRGSKFKWVEIANRRTKTIDKCLDPEWNATFEFANPRKFGSGWLKLVFEVYDEDLLGDDLIGECSLPDLSFLEDGDGTYSDWEQLFAEDGDEAGELHAVVTAVFTEEEQIKGAWARMDADGSGELERKEIGELMTQLGMKLSPNKLDKMMLEIDADGSGEVDFDEFYAYYAKPPARPPWPWLVSLTAAACGAGPQVTLSSYRDRERLLGMVEGAGRMRFEEIDEDGSGELDKEEVGILAKALGKKLTAPELDELMAEMDEDGSGTVDYEEFFSWYMAGVDNTGMDGDAQRHLYEEAPDVAAVALLQLGAETIPMLLLQLYVALTINSFDEIDFFEEDAGDDASDRAASYISMSVSLSVLLGLCSATGGWVIAEMHAWEGYDPFCGQNNDHGAWMALWRLSEMGARVLTLAAFGCSWRGWTFLLLFVDLLVISQLNLCERMSPSSLDNPGGDHLSALAQLYFGAVSTITYVGDPEKGLSCLCTRGAIITVNRYYAFRLVELGLMVLGWQLGVDQLTVQSPFDKRTCYDQVYLLAMAAVFLALTAISAPMVYLRDPRGQPAGDGDAEQVGYGDEGELGVTDLEAEVEDLFAKNAWESDSDDDGGDSGGPRIQARQQAQQRRPASIMRMPSVSQRGPRDDGSTKQAAGLLGETVSSVGWVAWDTADEAAAAFRSKQQRLDGVRMSRGSHKSRSKASHRAAGQQGSGEEEDESEYVPLTEEELGAIGNFQRATVKVMSDPAIPKAHKSRRIQQLVAARNKREAEAKRKAAADKLSRAAMQHWSNIQLRNTLQWRELDLILNERREAMIERLLADGFETGQRNRPSTQSREAQRAEAAGREAAAAQERRQAEAIRSEKAATSKELEEMLRQEGGGTQLRLMRRASVAVPALAGGGGDDEEEGANSVAPALNYKQTTTRVGVELHADKRSIR